MTTGPRASQLCSPTRINPLWSAMTPREEIFPGNAPSLADHIRQAARESGLSVYPPAKDAQVDQSTLNKFLTGDRDNLTLEVADRLFRVLGLRVTRPRRRGPGNVPPPEPPGGE